MFKVEEDTLAGACGVSVLFEFHAYYGKEISNLIPGAGIGLVCAGFVDGQKSSQEAFAEMEKRGPCVYKSPVRKNRNSGNMFYFAVFDWSENENAEYGFDDAEDAEDQVDDEGDF